MDIPINAKVYCQDKLCGHTQAVILNPVNDIVTHVVVKESKSPHTERLVPIDMVDASLTDNVHLNFNEGILHNLPSFFDVEYIQTTVPRYTQEHDMFYLEPIVAPETKVVEEKLYHVPKDELAVTRGTEVYSADGVAIGKIDEFLVDQSGGHVTHLILREGHIFGKKDVFIPVAEMESVNDSNLHLKLDKEDVEKLPAIPVKRIWP